MSSFTDDEYATIQAYLTDKTWVAGWNAAIEAAAKLLEAYRPEPTTEDWTYAAAIRALKREQL